MKLPRAALELTRSPVGAFSSPRSLRIRTVSEDQDPEKEEAPPCEGEAPKKQKLVGFSLKSRLELARQLSTVSCPHDIWHITMTYWQEWPATGEALDLEKERLGKAFKRAGLCGFWRLEFQRPRSAEDQDLQQLQGYLESEYNDQLLLWFFVMSLQLRAHESAMMFDPFLCVWRLPDVQLVHTRWPRPPVPPTPLDDFGGRVPHWHCLVYGSASAVDRVRDWWARTINPHPEGFKVGGGDEGKAAWYMGLHLAKLGDQSPDFPVGRWWGKLNTSELKRWVSVSQVAEEISEREVIWLKRLMRRMHKTRGSLGAQGFTWFLPQILHQRVLVMAHELAFNPPIDPQDRCKIAEGNPF